MDTFEQSKQAAKIKVVGVGGGGGNAVNTMIARRARRRGVHRRQHRHPGARRQQGAASRSRSARRSPGLGAGANPEIGREAALESRRTRSPRRSRAPTWCSSPPAWAAAPAPARRRSSPTSPSRLGALTVGVVTKPFLFEGNRRRKQAEQGLEELQGRGRHAHHHPEPAAAHARRPERCRCSTPSSAPTRCCSTRCRASRDLIQYHGFINVDFADVKTIMSEQGLALMGTGRAARRASARIEAMQQAIARPLLEDVTHRRRHRPADQHHRRPRHDAARGERGASRWSTTRPTRRRTSSSARSSTRTCTDEVKITVIATGFQHRGDAVRRPGPAPAHAVTRPAAVAPAEPAVLGPVRARATTPDPRPLAPTRHLQEKSLPLDEDQFDIPTFLRRQGQGDL